VHGCWSTLEGVKTKDTKTRHSRKHAKKARHKHTHVPSLALSASAGIVMQVCGSADIRWWISGDVRFHDNQKAGKRCARSCLSTRMDGCDLPPGLPPTFDGWMITFLSTFHLALGFNQLLDNGSITERTLRMIEIQVCMINCLISDNEQRMPACDLIMLWECGCEECANVTANDSKTTNLTLAAAP